MKRLLLLALAYSCLSFATAAQAGGGGDEKDAPLEPAFRKVIGGSSFESAHKVVNLPEGGYLVVGRTASHGDGDTDMHVIKLDDAGDVLWNKRYGNDESEEANDVVPTSDGGYLVIGAADDYDNPGLKNVWVVKLNKEGDILWDKRYGKPNSISSGQGITPTSDNGYLIVGNSISIEPDAASNVYAVKIDAEGSIVWENTYGGDSNEEGKDVTATPEGFAIVGSTESYSQGRWDIWLLRIDKEGNTIDHYAFGGKDNEMGNAIVSTQDGGVLLGGYTYSFSKGSLDAWVVKVGPQGQQQWHKSFGQESTDEAFSLLELGDGNFIMAGYIDIYEPNDEYMNISETANEALLVKLSPKGEVLWEKTLGGPKNQRVFSVIEAADGGLLLVGSTDEGNSSDTWVVKLRPIGK